MRRPTEIEIGQLVTASSGRDRGTVYVVIGVFSNTYVLLVNGQSRTKDCPKRKNVKHIVGHNIIDGMLVEKLRQKIAVTDLELREAVKKLTTSES